LTAIINIYFATGKDKAGKDRDFFIKNIPINGYFFDKRLTFNLLGNPVVGAY